MKKLDKAEVKEKFDNELIRCMHSIYKDKKPELYKAIGEIEERLDRIRNLQKDFELFKLGPEFSNYEKFAKGNFPLSKENIETLRYQSLNEFEMVKGICDEKLNLIEFICKSLNCKKGQITLTDPYSSRVFDPKEYLKRNIIVHVGNLISNLTVKEVTDELVFPKYVFGNFKLYLPASVDFSKIIYPDEIVSYDEIDGINILPNNKNLR